MRAWIRGGVGLSLIAFIGFICVSPLALRFGKTQIKLPKIDTCGKETHFGQGKYLDQGLIPKSIKGQLFERLGLIVQGHDEFASS